MILIGDGMADYPLDALDGRTPIEAASTPAIDDVVKRGILGLFCPIPPDLPPGSDIGNLSLFGYDPHTTFTGRAPLEAARMGIQLSSDQVAFRCNLVTLRDGVMASFTSGHIPTEQAAAIIESLNEGLGDLPVSFHTGVSYRHLAVITSDVGGTEALAGAVCTPPHDITDQVVEPKLPHGEASPFLLELMRRAAPILSDHPVNRTRIAAGQPPATSIWLWGQGRAPRMKTFAELYGISGAVVSAVDLVKGIGLCAGLEAPQVAGATGYLDTNYQGKVDAALDALERHDFVYLHIEAPDETAHEGRVDLKMKAIEDFDQYVVAPCLEYAAGRGDTRVLVAPDHITAISTKTHAGGPVPFAMCGAGITHGHATAYTEAHAEASGVLVRHGYRLVPHVLQASEITRETLRSLDMRRG